MKLLRVRVSVGIYIVPRDTHACIGVVHVYICQQRWQNKEAAKLYILKGNRLEMLKSIGGRMHSKRRSQSQKRCVVDITITVNWYMYVLLKSM